MVSDEQHAVFVERRRCGGIYAVALESVGSTVRCKASFSLVVHIDVATCCRQPYTSQAVVGDVAYVVVADCGGVASLMYEVGVSAGVQVVAVYAVAVGGYPQLVVAVDAQAWNSQQALFGQNACKVCFALLVGID